uniref:Secreted protein n=1 Tax=Oryza nivara TaxID=4536 RepID=A0A0E0G0K8_ORYNI
MNRIELLILLVFVFVDLDLVPNSRLLILSMIRVGVIKLEFPLIFGGYPEFGTRISIRMYKITHRSAGLEYWGGCRAPAHEKPELLLLLVLREGSCNFSGGIGNLLQDRLLAWRETRSCYRNQSFNLLTLK